MTDNSMTLLVISGTVGVGKTTVANELSTLLESRNVAHTFIDLDALAATFPRRDGDPFGDTLALTNLHGVWRNCRDYGSRNLIIVCVVETPDYAARLSHTVDIANPIVCELRANPTSLIGRVRTREVGSAQLWHERRSLSLADDLAKAGLADLTVETDNRSVTDIAREIDAQVRWAGDS